MRVGKGRRRRRCGGQEGAGKVVLRAHSQRVAERMILLVQSKLDRIAHLGEGLERHPTQHVRAPLVSRVAGIEKLGVGMRAPPSHGGGGGAGAPQALASAAARATAASRTTGDWETRGEGAAEQTRTEERAFRLRVRWPCAGRRPVSRTCALPPARSTPHRPPVRWTSLPPPSSLPSAASFSSFALLLRLCLCSSVLRPSPPPPTALCKSG